MQWLIQTYQSHVKGFSSQLKTLFPDNVNYQNAIENLQKRWDENDNKKSGATYLTLKAAGQLPLQPTLCTKDDHVASERSFLKKT